MPNDPAAAARRPTTVRGTERWQEVVAARQMSLWIDAPSGAAFEASMLGGRFDGVRVFTVRASPHTASRSERLADTGDPHYWLVFQLEGESTIAQGGSTSILRPGDAALYDSTMPYTRTFPVASRTLVALLPQQLMPLPPRALARLAGLRIGQEQPMGAILGGFLQAVAERLPDLGEAEGRSTVQAMVTLVIAATAPRVGSAPPRSRRWEQLVRIRDWIMSHLDDPDLDPAAIAAAHFVSLRHLHSLFHEQDTTVATWVRERRLEMARRDLQETRDGASIRDIALRWGFTDPAWFARAFRRAYGLSPSAARARPADDVGSR